MEGLEGTEGSYGYYGGGDSPTSGWLTSMGPLVDCAVSTLHAQAVVHHMQSNCRSVEQHFQWLACNHCLSDSYASTMQVTFSKEEGGVLAIHELFPTSDSSGYFINPDGDGIAEYTFSRYYPCRDVVTELPALYDRIITLPLVEGALVNELATLTHSAGLKAAANSTLAAMIGVDPKQAMGNPKLWTYVYKLFGYSMPSVSFCGFYHHPALLPAWHQLHIVCIKKTDG
jgi:hypothetical protein